jgi:hypothetical protein
MIDRSAINDRIPPEKRPPVYGRDIEDENRWSPYEFQLTEISRKLANASDPERNRFEASPSGHGIHWPLLDGDLSIDGLLGLKHSPEKIKETV